MLRRHGVTMLNHKSNLSSTPIELVERTLLALDFHVAWFETIHEAAHYLTLLAACSGRTRFMSFRMPLSNRRTSLPSAAVFP
jgi:hypothetical protein